MDAGQQSGRWRRRCGGRPGLRRKTIIVFQHHYNTLSLSLSPKDVSEEEQIKFLQEMDGDWLSVKFLDPANEKLKKALDVVELCVTRIVAVDGCSMKISGDGREAIIEKGAEAFAEWENAARDLIDVSAVKMLEFNQQEVKRRAVDILTKLLSNVQQALDVMKQKYKARGEEVEIKAVIGDAILLETTLQKQLNSCLRKSPSPERKRDKLRFHFPQESDDEQ